MQANRKALSKAKDVKGTVKRLLLYLRPYLLLIIISIILAIVGAVFSVSGPNVSRRIMNTVQDAITATTQEGAPFVIDFATIWNTVLILSIIHVLAFLFSILQGIIITRITQTMAKKLRSALAEKINDLPLKYLDKRNYGDILSIAANDVDMLSQGINSSVSDVLRSVALVLATGVYMFLISWQMALVAILTVPLSIFTMSFIMKKSQKYFIKNQQNLGKLNGFIEESYSGHEILAVFNAAIQRKKEFDVLNDKMATTSWKSQFYSGIMYPIMGFLGNISYGIAAVVGALSGFAPGDVMATLVYNRNFSQPINNIGQSFSQIQAALAAAERVFEFLDAKEMSSELGFTIHDRPILGAVQFKDVRFGYDEDKEIIHGFNLDVKAGQKIAIVGPTGAGKTTLVNLLMKFYEVNSGDIIIDGVSIKEMKRSEVHDAFGMVLQDTWLFKGTIAENLIFNKEGVTDIEMRKIAKLANIDHFIEAMPLSYNTYIEDADNVSQGQKQLFTIARAMFKNAPILILDEATSNVDTRTEIMIQDAMDSLMKGRTSFVIAHRLSTIKNADVILVLNEGDIVETGNHEVLMAKNGFYAQLYNSQFEI